MILKSKLSNKHPVADLSYLTGDTANLDPIFAGRLAYVAKINNGKFKITSGFRSYEDQVKMYNDYKSGKLKATAAVPGTSWHGSRLAVDTSTQPIRGMNNAQLKKYGLCKPLSREGWHIQPLETSGKTNRAAFAPEEADDMKKEEVLKIIDESRAVYKMPSDVPAWAKPTVDKLIKNGYLAPEKDGSINLTQEMLRTLAIVDRMVG